MTVEVVKPGLLTTLQDAGRRGYAHLGVGRSGPFDAPALRIANALCGNSPDACGAELTLAGPTLHFRSSTWIAITGAPMPVHIDEVEAPMWAPLPVHAGSTVRLGAMRSGCRACLAVQGGFDPEPVLGSRSTDVNAGIGPLGGRAWRKGDILTFEGRADSCIDAHKWPGWRLDPRPWFESDPHLPLRLLPGRHFNRLREKSSKSLFHELFKMLADSNRMGVRLSGPKLEFDAPVEMISEGCVPGLLQLPPSGEPIAFGPEGPVSGGYPRIGQIAAVDLPRLAQCRPGGTVRFVPCTLDQALIALRERERALDRLEAAIRRRLLAGRTPDDNARKGA